MKLNLLLIITVVTLLFFPKVNFGQVISLGPDASKFVLFTSSGAVGDNASAHSHITGDVGTLTAGPMTGFGNIDGIMHPGVDPATTACEIDLQATIAQLNSNPATLVGPLALGSGLTLTPGIYSIPGNATLTLDLILDGLGSANAEFVFKVAGTFSTNTLSRVRLINGAKACHVFWKIDGAVTMASLTTMRGNIISGGLINMGSGDSLEGRAFSTPAGAITIDGITAYMPIGCGSPILTGPPAVDLASLYCYTIFSSIGALDGNLSSTSIGDVGNAGGGSVTGWTAGNVTGTLHPTGDPSTMLAATDLTNVYNTLNAMIPDIELLYPVLFGRNLVLTPHVYLMSSGGAFGPATLTDSLYLDAQGNSNAVFVIKITGGGLTTSVNSRVKLINGAQAKNVFWMIDGAVEISDNSIFRGNIVVSAGAINLRYTGVVLEGRALSINGAITTAGLAAAMTPGCGAPCVPTITNNPQTICNGGSYTFNGNIYTLAGNYNDTLTAIDGCDSIIVTQLSVSLLLITNNPQTICNGGSYIFNGNTYILAGNYNDTLTSISGCDSIIVTQLSVSPLFTTNNPQTICNGGSYIFNGNTYTLAGNYNDTLISIAGCDSIIVTQLSVVPFYTTNNPQTICNGGSYIFNGNTYTLAGNYNDTLISIAGCDSIIVTQLSVVPFYTTNNPQTICNGGSYIFNGNTYTLTGYYNDTLISIAGCDSIIVTQLSVVPFYTTNNPQTICNGGSYIFNGNTYTLAGNYNDTLISINGCDSIIVTQLSVVPFFTTNNPQAICDGVSYIFNGNIYTLTGNYNDTLLSVNGCDSIIVTQLTVNQIPVSAASSNSPVCIGSAINLSTLSIAGATYSWINTNGYTSVSQNPIISSALATDAGIYTLVVSNNGCSSIPLNITVVVNDCDTVDFFIPEGFSPNGDGINDLFVIRGIDRFPNNAFEVFNRWGNKVFEANSYLNTWDGTTTFGIRVGGDKLPIATYFYVLDLGDGSNVYKGTIYLNR
ncbi:MAG: DUF3494 domain-containing protein [Bacteroidia bacterium]|nr:DUF3494 domain-containing protein [Bacteroidia bacterium]